MKKGDYEKMIRNRKVWPRKLINKFIITQATAEPRKKKLPFTKIGQRPPATLISVQDLNHLIKNIIIE